MSMIKILKFWFLGVFLCLIVWSVSAGAVGPAIFLGELPDSPIVLRSPQEALIPVFIFMGDRAGQPVEFFVWREWKKGGPQGIQKEYLFSENGSLHWEPFYDLWEIKPLTIGKLPWFVNVYWKDPVFLDEMSSRELEYILYVCFDFDLNQSLEEGAASLTDNSANASYCANATVVYSSETVSKTLTRYCKGLNINKVSVTFFQGIFPSYGYNLLDGCGNALTGCTIQTKPSFLGQVNFDQNRLVLDFSKSLAPGNYTSNLTFSCGDVQYNLPITVQVLGTTSLSSCSREVLLEDAVTGTQYGSGQTIVLNDQKTLNVKCNYALFSRNISKFAFTPETRCFYAQEKQGQLLLIPKNDVGEACVANLTIKTRDKVASFVINVGGQSNLNNNLSSSCSLSISVTKLDFSATGAKTIYIKDSCGKNLSYEVTNVKGAWIVSPQKGQRGSGYLEVKVSASGMSSGTYFGEIELQVDGYGTVKIPVSLKITTASTTPSVWFPSLVTENKIEKTLALGETASENGQVTCSGRPPSSFKVAKLSGGQWFSVTPLSSGGVKLSFNSSGLSAGQSYSGSFQINTECGSKVVSVTLNISGVCEATNATLSKNTLTVQVQAGSNGTSEVVYVKDNCGKPLGFKVLGIKYTGNATDWLSATNATIGELKLNFKTQNLGVGTYSAELSVKPESFNSTTLSLIVNLKVLEKIAYSQPNAISLTNGKKYYYSFGPGSAKLFTFYSASHTTSPYLTVGIHVASAYVDSQMIGLLVNGGINCENPPPDLSYLKDLRQKWEKGLINSKGKTSEGYYYYVSNSLVKNIRVVEEIPKSCWYLWVYNASPTRSFSDVIIAVSGPSN